MSWTHAKPLNNFQHTNTSPQKYSNPVHKPIEIYVFIDPFCSECWSLQPYLLKLYLEYGHLFTFRTILSCHLKVLNESHIEQNHKSSYPTNMYSWIPLAIKAAELQGKNAGKNFLRQLQEYYFLRKMDVIDKQLIIQCAEDANLDVQEFKNDICSATTSKALQCDLAIIKEMEVQSTPTFVFFNQAAVDEQGIKVSGIYSYDIYVSILEEMMHTDIDPLEKPSLEDFLAHYKIAGTKELSIIYDWSIADTLRQLKKLQMMQKVKCIPDCYDDVWKYIKEERKTQSALTD